MYWLDIIGTGTESNMDLYKFTVKLTSDKKGLEATGKCIAWIPESDAKKMTFTSSFM